MALAIMIYHYTKWTIGFVGAEFLLGKLGIYAVSIFYILSGLSLTIVYRYRISGFADIRDFFIKRIFRIFPLFWVAVSASLVFRSIEVGFDMSVISWKQVALNYSLLFGFLDHDGYLSTGAWSIGNEIVFYSILPIIFLATRKVEHLGLLVFAVSLVFSIYFSYFALDSSVSLRDQWSTYIHPLNQVFLFFGGVIIGTYGGLFRENSRRIFIWASLLACSFAAFALYPATGDHISIVTGNSRFIFSVLCLAFVWSVYSINPIIKSGAAKALAFLGEGCYSIYLLHPLVAVPIVWAGSRLDADKWLLYLVAGLLTLAVSWVTFKYIERPMMAVGKKITHRLRAHPNVHLTPQRSEA